MANASEEMHKATVLSIHNRIKQRIVNLLKDISTGDQAKVQFAAGILKNDLESLVGTLAPEHRPSWIELMRGSLYKFSKGDIQVSKLLLDMSDQKSLVERHNWSFPEEDFKGFDFDKIFDSFRAENNLNDLFDRTISLLQEILDSGEIDSIYAKEVLESLIGSMIVSKKGSLYSMEVVWQFFASFAKNFLLDQLESISGFGSLVKAVRETLEQGDLELLQIKKEAFENAQENVRSRMGFYSKKNNQLAIGYGNTGALIEEQQRRDVGVSVDA